MKKDLLTKTLQRMIYFADKRTPIFFLFGYSSIGKTMITQRLAKYLRMIGMTISIDSALSDEPFYVEECKNYLDDIYTNSVSFHSRCPILINVYRYGKKVCELLDVPGQWCFDYHMHISNPAFPSAIMDFVHTPNKKIWGFVIEMRPCLNSQERSAYVQAIHKMNRFVQNGDKVIFIYNKIDITPFVIGYNKINYKGLFDSADSIFPNLFAPFEEMNVFMRMMKGRYSFTLLPFQTGVFCNADVFGNNCTSIVSGPDEYPKRLWTNILKIIK